MPSEAALIDPRLEADTLHVGDLDLCAVRLMDDARFPWLVLVPRRAGLVELIDLAPEDGIALAGEVADVSRVLRSITSCDKLNVAALGNVVSQLHIHVIGRFIGDAAWPRPVWGEGRAERYDPAVADALAARLRAELVLV
ncbi:MAG TPA: HIT domain-containing protein [Xanthobacteraceae bacterium]|nr:HIT domain-containing protein [Xanthobacteraceae bacterium]